MRPFYTDSLLAGTSREGNWELYVPGTDSGTSRAKTIQEGGRRPETILEREITENLLYHGKEVGLSPRNP